MDGDPAVEPRLDSFSLTFPLPYRVAFIIISGLWKPAQISLEGKRLTLFTASCVGMGAEPSLSPRPSN